MPPVGLLFFLHFVNLWHQVYSKYKELVKEGDKSSASGYRPPIRKLFYRKKLLGITFLAFSIPAKQSGTLIDKTIEEIFLNPDFVIKIVVSGKMPIKTGVLAGFLVDSIEQNSAAGQMPVFEAFFM